jgi:hypothetical protein
MGDRDPQSNYAYRKTEIGDDAKEYVSILSRLASGYMLPKVINGSGDSVYAQTPHEYVTLSEPWLKGMDYVDALQNASGSELFAGYDWQELKVKAAVAELPKIESGAWDIKETLGVEGEKARAGVYIKSLADRGTEFVDKFVSSTLLAYGEEYAPELRALQEVAHKHDAVGYKIADEFGVEQYVDGRSVHHAVNAARSVPERTYEPGKIERRDGLGLSGPSIDG